jgi:hypothetical protein
LAGLAALAFQIRISPVFLSPGRVNQTDALATAFGAAELRYEVVPHGAVIWAEILTQRQQVERGAVMAKTGAAAVGGHGVTAIDDALNRHTSHENKIGTYALRGQARLTPIGRREKHMYRKREGMMPALLTHLEQKPIGETRPGELFRARVRGALAVCLTVGTEQQDSIGIALLRGPNITYPSYTRWARLADPCLSYGTEWQIEPIPGDETFPTSPQLDEQIGVIFLDGTSVLLRVDPVSETAQYGMFFVDLLKGEACQLPQNASPFKRWRIWHTPQERDRPNGAPIVSFGHEAGSAQ